VSRLGYAVVTAGLVALAVWPTQERAGIRGSGSSPGYVLFAPLLSGTTYVIDTSGRVVHTWRSEFAPGDPPPSVFRATFIPPDHPAVAGRDLAR
jgi:hypothetical protein